jgi:hypothetical protein
MLVTAPPCGTPEGYRWHCGHGEERDQACKDAIAAYNRARRRGEPPPKWIRPPTPPDPSLCGTRRGYRQHARLGEAACEACRVANIRGGQQRDVPCAGGCGRLLWGGKGNGSRPESERMCQECRKATGRPNRLRTRPNRPSHRLQDFGEVFCRYCGQAFRAWRPGMRFCSPEHRQAWRNARWSRFGDEEKYRARSMARKRGRRPSPEAAERLARRQAEYASREHRLGRRAALAAAGPETPCARCREPLGETVELAPSSLHYDHRDDRSGYLGLSHGPCNVKAGARRSWVAA